MDEPELVQFQWTESWFKMEMERKTLEVTPELLEYATKQLIQEIQRFERHLLEGPEHGTFGSTLQR